MKLLANSVLCLNFTLTVKSLTVKSSTLHFRYVKTKDIYVCRFEKGSGVVIDTKETYVTKMMAVLVDGFKLKPFTKPTRQKDRFVRCLSTIFNDCHLSVMN